MKQKSINAFFSGGKAAQSKECDNTVKAPTPAKKSVTPAKKTPSKAPQPASPLAQKQEETKPEPQPVAAPATAPADAEDDDGGLEGPSRAHKRLRRTVIEEDDDDGPPQQQQQSADKATAQEAGASGEDTPMADTEAGGQGKAGAGAGPAAADAAAAPAASKPAAPLASIFQKPGRKPSAAAGANGSPAKGGAARAAGKAAGGKGAAAVAASGAAPDSNDKVAASKDNPAKQDGEGGAGGSDGGKAAARKERKRAGGDEEGDEDEDPISDSDDDAGGEPNGVLADGGASAGGAKKRAKKAAAKGDKAAGKVEGVGTGALAAAAKYAEQDYEKLITWKAGAPVPYSMLANTFETIADTTKRLEIVGHLVAAFRAILATTPADLLPAVYLCVNRVAPAHMGVELGVGEATLIKALCEATGKNEASIKKAYEASGDLGVVAVGARSTQKTMFAPPPLTVPSVLKMLKDIAQASGNKSGDYKRGIIVKMLVASKGNETGYVMRSLQAKLRIGLAEQSVLVALSHAVHLHRNGVKGAKDGRLAEALEAAAQAVKHAYSECPSYDVLIPALVEHGTDDLSSRCHFMPGVPVKPMLAKATTGVSEVLEKFTDQEFTVEYKYDGERAQVHVLDGGKTVHIFSRNAENNTGKYPDIVARLPGLLQPHVKSIVFDSEAVAWDNEKKKIQPFQVLSTRARKDVAVGDIKVQVVLFAFDCLYLNGESMLHRPLTERREALYGALREVEGQLAFASAKTSRDVEELATFLNESVEAGTEGLIVKTLKDTYEPSKRSSHWLKLKKDYMEGVGDTFDVVPLGAFYGKGKRTGVFGAYLLGIYDPDTETYQTISKLGTGFSEEQLQQLADSMRPHIIPQPRNYYRWSDQLVPDVWFDTVAVWEVKAADLSISPVHQAAMGLVDPEKGISIRFPRLIRVRDDKSPEDATSATQVAEMFRNQAVIRQQQAGKADADEEYD